MAEKRATYTDKQKDEARKLYLQTQSYKEVSSTLGIPVDILYKWGKNFSWSRKAIRQKRQKIAEKATEKFIENSAEEIAELNARMLKTGKGLFTLAEQKMNEIVKRINRIEAGSEEEALDALELQRLSTLYQNLVASIRLQTGQTTETPAMPTLPPQVKIEIPSEKTTPVEDEEHDESARNKS